MKKKFAVYGNCQSLPIAKLLQNNSAFSESFEEVKFSQPVYMLNNKDWPHIHDVVSSVDLLICQKVGDAFGNLLATENLFAHTKSDAIKISYPSIYFNGYFTEVDYLRGMPQEINHFCEYHDLNIANNFLQSETIEQAKKVSLEQIQDPQFYSEEQVQSRVKGSLDELKSREVNLDTTIADFIESHWQQGQLFFSVNHPSRRVLLEICRQILSILEISDKHIPGSFEHLGATILPVYESVKKNMCVSELPALKVKGNTLSHDDYVTGLLETYAKQDPILLGQVVAQLRQKKGL